MSATPHKTITYSRKERMFLMYVDGVYVGSCERRQDAEEELNRIVHRQLKTRTVSCVS